MVLFNLTKMSQAKVFKLWHFKNRIVVPVVTSTLLKYNHRVADLTKGIPNEKCVSWKLVMNYSRFGC